MEYAVRLTVGVILATYWYYIIQGYISGSMSFFLLFIITVLYGVSFLPATSNSPRDSMGDKPGGGNVGHV
ncbi:MAG: hypothetical protein ACOC89_04265 [Candidatus Saliniplasma sp.]